MKKILFAASECVPFIKTGGLADVCGALPKEFDKEEWDVRVVGFFSMCLMASPTILSIIRNTLTASCLMGTSGLTLRSSVFLTRRYSPF